jgi:hypothetical protein
MPPYFGIVKRAMNRAPGPRDPWWKEHEEKCGGVYTKIKEPDSYQKKNNKKKSTEIEKKEKNKGKKPLTSVKDFFSCMQDKKVKEMLPTNPTEQKSFPCSTTQSKLR